jgi:hypothetical protein
LAVVAVPWPERNARVQDREVADIAAVHRKFNQAPLFDGTANGSFIRAEVRAFGSDGDLLCLRAYLKSEVDTELLVDLEDNPLARFGFETSLFDHDLVLADIENGKRVVSRIRGYSGACNTGSDIRGSDLRAGDRGSGSIGDGAKD